MFKKIFILTFIAIFFIACQTGKEDAKNFSAEFTKITEDLRVKREKVSTRDEYAAYKTELKEAYENLLKKFAKSPSIEEIELLRCKALLKLEKLDEAVEKIDKLLAEKPHQIDAIKMVKVQILLAQKKYGDAYEIFKDIEPRITDPHDLANAYYNLASEFDLNKAKAEYAKKFLEFKQIPASYVKYRPEMFLVLASLAKQGGDIEKSRKLLNEGITDSKDSSGKVLLEKTLEQLDYIGKTAFPFSAETWLNSSPRVLENMKGQVVILFFWAPWCPSCRALTPSIVALDNEFKGQGLTIIGCTRLYGSYEDDVLDKGKVNKNEEIEFIKTYLERKKISYPIAIADAKANYDMYKIVGLPTLVFIDKKGVINFTEIGVTSPRFLNDKVKQLLAENI